MEDKETIRLHAKLTPKYINTLYINYIYVN